MGKISMKGVCDMHVHTNPDLRLRAYDDFQLADAAVRVGARAIVIKTHLGFTVNRAYLTNQYVKRVYGENTGFTMYGGLRNAIWKKWDRIPLMVLNWYGMEKWFRNF